MVAVNSVQSGSKNCSSRCAEHWEASLVSCWTMEEMSYAAGWRRRPGRLTSAKPFLGDPCQAVPAARRARPCWHGRCWLTGFARCADAALAAAVRSGMDAGLG